MAEKVELSTADHKSIQLMQSLISRMVDLTANVGQDFTGDSSIYPYD